MKAFLRKCGKINLNTRIRVDSKEVKVLEIKLKNIEKNYNDLSVIKNFNISFSSDKVHCIFGPSGSGKSTLLNIITKLENINSGEIEGTENKKFSYVFQEDRLLPWLNVEENIEFVLESSHGKNEAKEKAKECIELVKLSKFAKNFPRELSGGMKQRVAIARAIAYDGDIFVMDEPFKALEMELKKVLMDYIVEYCYNNNKLLIYTTHDAFEAVYMSDNLYVFDGPPLKLKKQINIELPFKERRINISEVKKLMEILEK
ncbi:ABC transporter ATP-binding protein [Clostridium hydrogenum]|uniref:ABC transporter ATP-binding protein n=1 Tax=Clostridium hydrogenum TaxID=2855764 RepID=UPI001F2E31A7|nr:ABC transporter ATP-binding protein [Clostridium hydrogenum]